MSVNFQAQVILDIAEKEEIVGAPSPEELGAKELRIVFKKSRGSLTPEVPDVGHVEDFSTQGPGGKIPVRYYRPIGSELTQTLPLLIYFHGGGWVVGDRDTHDVICRMLANRGQFAVINVDYRLAPENKFPAAVEDAWAVFKWAVGGAGGHAIDVDRIAVGGDSAGGNLSAVVAIMARDFGLNLSFQALIYPATSFHLNTASQEKFYKGYLLTKEVQDWYHAQYLRNESDRDDWRASPMLSDNLRDVAPAFILTCGYDPLVDEGRSYAEKLKQAGVQIKYRCFEGQVHGFITMGRAIDEANEAVYEVADSISSAFK